MAKALMSTLMLKVSSLAPTVGTEMAKIRPGVIVTNDHVNKGSNRVSVVLITSSNIAMVYSLRYFYRPNLRPGLTMIQK
ncbi:MAG: hypothetical protein CV087_13335 [Candidatus Brocadia sp. WS118]|nr:MAG: hypothetical protein CV087_13335 [Candidatus Brocadia sp. WS118]